MPRVLVVEDDTVLMDVLRQAFRTGGWEVDAVAGAADALATLAAAPGTYDILLTDKNLPGMTGVELIREVRRTDGAIGIVLMTGYGSVESARDTLNLGVDEYLEKPFENIFGVLDHLRALLDKVATRRASKAGPPSGPLTILVAAAPQRRAYIARHLQGLRDRLVYVDNPDDIKPSARSERADLVILDGGSFPEEITCLVAELKARARFAGCLVLSEHLTLSDVKRLIELEVKALIDDPPESDRFGLQLSAAVERMRRIVAK
jgi:DNA-binding response OmpR family regulator